jgi:hypothetical protein
MRFPRIKRKLKLAAASAVVLAIATGGLAAEFGTTTASAETISCSSNRQVGGIYFTNGTSWCFGAQAMTIYPGSLGVKQITDYGGCCNYHHRIWFHQYSNGGGWADCYYSDSWIGGRDVHPGNIFISSNTAPC